MLPHAAGRPVGPILLALAATLAVLNTLRPDAAGPLAGPGITCDEGYRVARGKQLVTTLAQQGLDFFLPANVRANFAWQPGDPPVEPPLGHLLLGLTHYLFDPEPDLPGVSIISARFAPALAFGLLVLLIGLWITRVEGHLAGTVAAAAVVLVPRVFAHAHLAALDMLTTLFFVAAVLAVAEASRSGRWWQFALAGVVWGLAMLVRLHGVLLFPPVIVWLIWRLRLRVWLPLLAWAAGGMATLFALWPWLWLAPISHLRLFLASGADRQAVNVFYAGGVWADHQAPWHYPFVMFLVALPLGLLLLGSLGIWSARRGLGARPHLTLAIGTWLFVLSVFAFPGVPVYDGARLFLMAFPLWAACVAIGAKWLVEHPALPRLSRRVRLVTLGVFLVLQATGLVIYHPCQLSHYSLLVGGLPGAQRLGFEVSYWGDAVREPMLRLAAEHSGGCPILLAPHLAPWQADATMISSPALADYKTELVGWDPNDPVAADECRFLVVYNRRADLDVIQWALTRGQVVDEYTIQGVWLARLILLPRPDRDAGS